MAGSSDLRVSLAQVNPTVGAVEQNSEAILSAWRSAAGAGADLVVFPELVLTGYPPSDLLLEDAFVQANLDALQRLASEGPGSTAAVVGFVARVGTQAEDRHWDVAVPARSDLRNAAAVLAGGQLVATYHKARLPSYAPFSEARWFTAGGSPCVVSVGDRGVGITICEDLWMQDGPVARSVEAGAGLVVNLSASPYHRGKRLERERWITSLAQRHGVWVAYVNAWGGQDGLVFDGDSMVADPTGRVVARGAQFDEDLVVADVTTTGDAPQGAPVAPISPEQRRPLPPRDEAARLDPIGEVWEALVTGTRDYFAKNGFEEALLGLSGGVDSSLVAALAADAVGADNVLGVLMPSPHSSEHSVSDAEQLADNLGIQRMIIEIDSLMAGFEDALEEAFAGRERDVAEENIQARIRGMLLMAISNKHGHLVLVTGNKSEASVGYATLYGDMAGGFAPIIDCDKELVYALCRQRNQRGPAIPENVLAKAPSAELSPGQTDEDSLPPYEVLDAILRMHVEEAKGVEQIVAAGHDEETVREVVRMVNAAEFKRRQSAPGVRISQRSLSDRDFPITNKWRP